MIRVSLPEGTVEQKYIINIIFKEFLGLPYVLSSQPTGGNYLIKLNNQALVIKNILLHSGNDQYLKLSSLPKVTYVQNQFTPEENIPVLYGNEALSITETSINCDMDIFGGCFFMLSRMEEAVTKERDEHGRFSAKSSVAYKNGFLDRPIVDEYVEMLWNMLAYLAPTLKRNVKEYKNFITCDLDLPFDPVRRSIKKTLLKSGADLIKRKSVRAAFSTWAGYVSHLFGRCQYDAIKENISWIMDENEILGNKVAFYFITEITSHFDGGCDFSSVEMTQLLTEIHMRGHEIGLHPGYNCFDNKKNFRNSAKRLRVALEKAGIKQGRLGGRMHYLRWDVMQTPQLWESEGFDYDSTLSYADQAGFRCGTSNEFTMFDLVGRQTLRLKQRPLINMECTVISSKYENLAYSTCAMQRFEYFKKTVRKYKGIYTVLWHNSHLITAKDKVFYRELIK